jgi:hypothetical protein
MIVRFKLSAAHWESPEAAVHALRAKAVKSYGDWEPGGAVTINEVLSGGQAFRASIVLQKETDW